MHCISIINKLNQVPDQLAQLIHFQDHLKVKITETNLLIDDVTSTMQNLSNLLESLSSNNSSILSNSSELRDYNILISEKNNKVYNQKKKEYLELQASYNHKLELAIIASAKRKDIQNLTEFESKMKQYSILKQHDFYQPISSNKNVFIDPAKKLLSNTSNQLPNTSYHQPDKLNANRLKLHKSSTSSSDDFYSDSSSDSLDESAQKNKIVLKNQLKSPNFDSKISQKYKKIDNSNNNNSTRNDLVLENEDYIP
ncbi:hypothetical protein AYI69_g9087 [Smittium culicis]|uniref:Uncharacterized protein n=1 Tax=Smittium culicis TaxID=133412 RepID=A0A1R1XEZ9_9FUNG|nr:hypothetical protein AYI69_g9087 [Smittium culicis]